MVPDGYELIEGSIFQKGRHSKKVVNAVPEVQGRIKLIDHETKMQTEKVIVLFWIEDQPMESMCQFEIESIRKGTFIFELPIGVIIEPRCRNVVRDIFQWCIMTGMKDLPLKIEEVYPYGWSDKKFHWEDGIKNVPEEKRYQIVTEAVILMKTGSDAIISMFLGSTNGALRKVLYDAGINHNFVTAIEGGSGVGKTSVLELCNNGVTGKAVSLASDRKLLFKILEGEKDRVWILDDFNKAESGRTGERVKQTVSEIIQSQSDAERLITEGGEVADKSIHVIISSESSFKNFSTINRTYRVEMDEPLPLEVFKRMKAFGSENMLYFIQLIIKFVELNYDDVIEQIRSNYQLFLDECRNKYEYSRIADTIAVQKTLKAIIILFYKNVGIDENHTRKIDMVLEESISHVGREMCGLLTLMNKEVKKMIALPRLADVIRDCNFIYDLSDNEKKYMKEKRNLSGESKTIGFCAVEGYLSFDIEAILELINSDGSHGGDISKQLLLQELKDQGLLYKDAEKKYCSRWHTKNRMYHMTVRPLLEMFRWDMGDKDIQCDYDMITEQIIQKFKP